MIEIVTNEKEWMENAINNLDLGKHPLETISRYARYLYATGCRGDDIESRIEEFMIRCNPRVNLVKWHDVIHSVAKRADKYPLISVDGVAITDKEIQSIESLKSKMARKLLFTLICLAKFRNAINPNNNGWVNYRSSDIFSLANVTLCARRQALMLNDLWRDGMVGYSKVVDNININVAAIDTTGNQLLYIRDFRNLGNQYLMYCGEKYFPCAECGLIEKRVSNNQLFCKKCAAKINARRTAQHYHECVA